MKDAGEMGLGAMISIPNFIKIVSAIQKMISGKHKTPRKNVNGISLLSFLQNNEK